MAETVNTYWAKFGIDSSDFTSGMGKAQGSFLAFYSQLTIAAEMSIQLIGRIGAEIKKFGDTANQIMDLSYQTGIATDKLQQYNYAALLAGSSNQQMSASLNFLSKSMGEATVATSAQAKAFKELGIATDGRSTDQVFDDVATALVGMSDVTNRNRIANDLFGRSYKEVLPILETYIKNIDDIRAHPIYSEEDLKTLNEAKVRWESLGDTVTVVTGKMLAAAESDPLGTKSRVKLAQMAMGLTGEGEISGAGARVGEAASAQVAAVNQVSNAYAGLTDEQIDLMDAEEALTKAQAEQAAAMKTGNQEAYTIASRSVALYTNRVVALKQAMVEMNAESLKASASTRTAWDNSAIVGTAGSEMYDYLMTEMANGVDYQAAMTKWSQGAQHNQAGSLGAAKDSGASTNAKVKKVSDENKKISDATMAGYIELEKMTLTHETALAEMSRTKYQALLDYAAEAVNWAGSHPIIQKSAVLTKFGYDIDISPLAAVQAPKLASADFSGIKTLGGTANTGGAGGNTNNNNVTVNVYAQTNDPKKIAAVTSTAVADSLVKGGAS